MSCQQILKRGIALGATAAVLCVARAAAAPALPIVTNVEPQPLVAQVNRLIETLEYTGSPLPAATKSALHAAMAKSDATEAGEEIQKLLDPLCLVGVNINPESRVKVAPGPAKPELIEQGWRQFLVKVHNEAGVTAELRAESPNAGRVYRRDGERTPLGLHRDLWFDFDLFNSQPLKRELSGLKLEYRLLQLFSRDAGQRAKLHSTSARARGPASNEGTSFNANLRRR